MGDEVEFIYNTHLLRRSSDTNTRLAAALTNDIKRESNESEPDEIDPLADDEDEQGIDYVPEDDASDIGEEFVIEANEILDSDEEEEDENEMHVENQSENVEYFYGKDGTKWNKDEPTDVGRLRKRFRGGPKQQNSIPIEVFKKMFTSNISFIIITETNRYASDAILKWNSENPNSKPRVWKELTSTELDAFIGLLLVAGVSHNNMQNSSVLWRSDGLPIFRAAMSYRRFLALSRYIRFDDGRTRAFRQQTDKAAPIRNIWNLLNENLAKNYEPHENITVDEQLFPYRGKTKFTQYIPSKPAKYGIKVWWVYDSKTKYPLQGKLYTGREDGEEREGNQGEKVLLQLVNRYSNSGRTVIADNFFTTLEVAKRLAKNGISFVGNIQANKRCVPEDMKKNPSRPVLSSLFGFHENLISICSYVPKRNKVVNLISTLHHKKHVEGRAMKPEAISFYNTTKAGANGMDQMVTQFSSKRSTKRWTLAFFCNILDVMALAAFCICKELDRHNTPGARRTFLFTLSTSLVLANIENRMNNVHIVRQFSTRLAFESFFGKPLNVSIQIKLFAFVLNIHLFLFSLFHFSFQYTYMKCKAALIRSRRREVVDFVHKEPIRCAEKLVSFV